MPALSEYQRAVSRYLLDGPSDGLGGYFLSPYPETVSGLDLATIYRNNVQISLREALAATFPATQALVGEDFFALAARRFIAAHPPESAVLARYGASFPRFLVTLGELSGFSYVPDVAALEWARNLAEIAEYGMPLSADEFADRVSGAVEGAVTLSPGVSLIRSRYAVADIWRYALSLTEEAPPVGAGPDQFLIVYRFGDEIAVEHISLTTHEILAPLRDGEDFVAALSRPTDPETQELAIGEIGRLFARGIFAASLN